MANGVTTEWEDIQVKLGNYEAREKETPQHELNQKAQELMENYEDKKVQESDSDFDSDFEDDEFTRKYQQQRMENLKLIAQKPHFGSVIEISREQYVKEINEAPHESWVVIHMYQDYITPCQQINEWMNILAKRYNLVKFIKIVATKCVENYPDANCPNLLIYKGGKAVNNIYSVDKFLEKMTMENFERLLHAQGVIYNEEFVQAPEQIQEYKKLLFDPQHRSLVTVADDKVDDREYINQNLKSQKKYMSYKKE